MGKVRIKTLGIEEVEKKEKEKAKKRQETKKFAKGAHGGERVVSMAPSEEELTKIEVSEETEETKKTKTLKARPPRQRSHRYREKLTFIDRKKTYPLLQALELLRKINFAKFDSAVELHVNVLEKGLSGQLNFPHGTGKKIRVEIASDALIETIQKGKVDFDILVSHPEMMGKLARIAKILGPRGLMPNPKNGTISEDPERLALNFAKGQLNFRTESQAPIIHLTVGKLSMKEQELSENITSVIKAIGTGKIVNATLKSTMSPGIKLDLSLLNG